MLTNKNSVIVFSLLLTLLFTACNTTESMESPTSLEPGNESSKFKNDGNSGSKLSLVFVSGQGMKSRRDRFGLLNLSNEVLITKSGHHKFGLKAEFSKPVEIYES
jgi:hypothetical protein